MDYKELLNEDKIIRIRLYDFEDTTNSWYGRVEYKKGDMIPQSWWDRLMKKPQQYYTEDIICGWAHRYYTRSKWNEENVWRFGKEHLEEKDGIMYYKPRVRMYYSDENFHTKFFDTYEDAESFVKDITNRHKYIEVL